MEKTNVRESEIPWMQDEFPNLSTSVPEALEESNQIGTIVIFVVSAILAITLLFVIAVFIDCRQQKLANMKEKQYKKVIRVRIPRLGRPLRDDESTLADKMEQGDSSSANVIV